MNNVFGENELLVNMKRYRIVEVFQQGTSAVDSFAENWWS